MRVAMILNSFPEISEKFLLNQVIALLGEGVELDVYSAHRSKGEARHDIFDTFGVAKHVRCLEMPRGMKQRFLRAPFMFLRLLARNPRAAFRALDARKYRTVAKNCKLIWFGNAFAGEAYDVVHCHFGVNGLIGAYLKDCGFARRLIVTFHGSDINSYPSRFGLDVYRTLYERADIVTVNTAFTGGKVTANGCEPALIRIHPVGLLPEDYDGVERRVTDAHSILTVGRLVEKKGHEYFLRALPDIVAAYPDTVWRIAGSGPLSASLEALADELGMRAHVEFLGECTNDAVKEQYARAAVFVLSSVTARDGDMEGQGLVLQEAQYCRVPVVSTLHNGIPDGVRDGETGFLVPEKDSAALAAAIKRLFDDPERATAMGEAGRRFVAGRYNVRELARELARWYRELA